MLNSPAFSIFESGNPDHCVGHIEIADGDEASLFESLLNGCNVSESKPGDSTENISEFSYSDNEDDIIGYLQGDQLPAQSQQTSAKSHTDKNLMAKKVIVSYADPQTTSVLTERLRNGSTSSNGSSQSQNNLRKKNTSRIPNKNAIAARENREKKKLYVQCLEKNVQQLTAEVDSLNEKYRKQGIENKTLQEEVSYLRKLIANETGLSSLLKTFMKTPGITFKSSFIVDTSESSEENGKIGRANKRKGIYYNNSTNEKSTESKKQRVSESDHESIDIESTGGICLHVCNNQVSVEMCSLCAKNAAAENATGFRVDHTYVKI